MAGLGPAAGSQNRTFLLCSDKPATEDRRTANSCILIQSRVPEMEIPVRISLCATEAILRLKRAVAVFFLLAAVLPAGIISEVGDAGQTLGTAQNTTGGSNPLTDIYGAIAVGAPDVDLYRIYISNPAAFSAITYRSPDPPYIDDMLYLFDATGRGVYADDDGGANLEAYLPANHAWGPQSAGTYYLGIGSCCHFPDSAGGAIFDFAASLSGPSGPGGALPLNGWSGTSYNTGEYRIMLTGAEFPIEDGEVPEPATALLVSLGLLAVGVGSRGALGRKSL
jgi:hypothetical protein